MASPATPNGWETGYVGVDKPAASTAFNGGAEAPNLEGDYFNVAFLFLLYFMQGLPFGLSYTVDLLLQEGGRVPFEQQAIFSAISWPYSLKMLWAPLVDAFFLPAVGRRKTWLVPTQLMIGALLLYAGKAVPELLGDASTKPQIWPLTYLFFTLFFLAATQDIAVDGWALELLQKRNLGWASTCNAVGLTAGYTFSFTGLIAAQAYNLCSLEDFMWYSGLAFFATTFAVWALKKEKPASKEVADMSVVESYASLFRIVHLDSVKLLVTGLLTRCVATVAADTLTSRKLLGQGMPKESLASIMVLLTPVQIVLPGLISPYTASKPLQFFARSYVPRMALGAASALLVYSAPSFEGGRMPFWFWACILALSLVASVLQTIQFVSLMAFFAKVSDPSVGGSYMTLLNTATNMGAKWPSTLSLLLVSPLTVPGVVDGYYVLVGATLALGTVWIVKARPHLRALEALPEKKWRVA